MHSFRLSITVKRPEGNINAASFLLIALQRRNLNTAKEFLSFWSPERQPDDPLLPLSAIYLLTTLDATTSSEDVEFFRLPLDRGLDLNCDTSPGSPLARVGVTSSLISCAPTGGRRELQTLI